MKSLNTIIEELVTYAKIHLDLNDLDAIYVRNLLFLRLGVESPYEGEIDVDFIKKLKVPDVLLEELKEHLVQNKVESPDLVLVEVMGLLSPMPSFVADKVQKLEKEEPGKGLDYLFDLEIKNNYIQKTAIDRNIYFKKEYEDNFLEITINLSKPEKKNSDIAKLLIKKQSDPYPKCLLCKENLGYGGRATHPARENIRIIPMKLHGQNWFLQYSPYAYFDHHCIVINDEHHNMTISEDTFRKLLEFVQLYPTFFVGSNSDLPIVGGSILNHEHYQGGLHLLPICYAKDRKVYYQDDKVKVSSLNWYNSVIRLEGKSIDDLCVEANKIFHTWIKYDDLENEILSHTNETRHSTITPMARKIKDGYQLNLILRNNRCNEQYPDGIFHAHSEHHHIKQEGIGLIEAMGLFILPPRLKRQMESIENILVGSTSKEEVLAQEDMLVHKQMIEELTIKYGISSTKEQAHKIIEDYLAMTCREILCNTAVFKDTEKGRSGFDCFMKKVGY